MLNQLQKIYPSAAYQHEIDADFASDYIWFLSPDNDVIGIRRSEVTKKDLAILSTFMKKHDHLLPKRTIEEEYWYELIHGKSAKFPRNNYRFIYFSMQRDQIEPISFKEAITELFGKPIPILWINETTGILIEELTETGEPINYEQIIDILMADLSVHINFFIGERKHDNSSIYHYYTEIIRIGKIIFNITDKKVINYVQSIPFLLVYKLEHETKEQIITSILKNVADDTEMLHTIEMFLQHNLNVSETAKNMYMHRNSLQYRIDKFIKETGLNIQHFDHAFAVKLALTSKKILHH